VVCSGNWKRIKTEALHFFPLYKETSNKQCKSLKGKELVASYFQALEEHLRTLLTTYCSQRS